MVLCDQGRHSYKTTDKEDAGVTNTAVKVHLPGAGREDAGGVPLETLRELLLERAGRLSEEQCAEIVAALRELGTAV